MMEDEKIGSDDQNGSFEMIIDDNPTENKSRCIHFFRCYSET